MSLKAIGYMSFDVLVPVLLCVVIAGLINAACFEENAPFTSGYFKGEGVYSNNPEILLNSIPVWVDIVHR